MMRNKNIFYLVLLALFIAITMILCLIPNAGFIFIGPVAITIVHIPVLIGIMILPFFHSVALGLTFGIGSLIASFMYATTPLDLAFQNPLVSVLPRLCFSIISYFVLILLKTILKTVKHGVIIVFGVVSLLTSIMTIFGFYHLSDTYDLNILLFLFVGILIAVIMITFYFFAFKKNDDNYITASGSLIIGTLFHTLLVLGAIGLFNIDAYGNNADIVNLIMYSILTNGMIEALAAVLIGAPIVTALKRAFSDIDDHGIIFVNKKGTDEK